MDVKKYYKYLKDKESVENLCKKLELKENELYGLVELLQVEGYNIDIVTVDGVDRVSKSINRRLTRSLKESIDQLEEIKLCAISDTHLGSKVQQLGLLNKAYREAYLRGITTVLHCGDMVDGDYRNKRPAHPYELFVHGFDEQAEYIITHYPYVEGMTTYFIDGSHDQTHYLNGGATVGTWVSKIRDDLKYLGCDRYIYMAGSKKNVKIEMYHPGGGSAKALSYNPQEYINNMAPGEKPRLLLQGHYHKSYFMFYRNVHAIEVPCFMDKSGFIIKRGMSNIVGCYFITMYVNKNGEIQYFIPEEYLFDSSELKKDDYLKAKQLRITK